MKKIFWFCVFLIALMTMAIMFSPILGESHTYFNNAEAKELPDIKTYAKEKVVEKWSEKEWIYFHDLIKRESGWNPNAQNFTSTASGLAQFLNGTWKTVGCIKTDNPYQQIDCAITYVSDRYDSPYKAIVWHNKKNWY